MKRQLKAILLSILAIILILWGIVFAFWGFGFFVDVGILPAHNLLAWESALYGAIMIGWGVTLFTVGRIAFRKNDKELLRALLLGTTLWLLIEGLFSAYLGVWFNVGVDLGVFALFTFSLTNAFSSK